MENLYIKFDGATAVGYAYGEEWVAQALLMDDICYSSAEEAKNAWEKMKKGIDNKPNM